MSSFFWTVCDYDVRVWMWYKWLHTLVTRHQWRSQRTANNSGTTFLGFQTQEFGAAGLLRQFIDHLYHMEDPGVDGRTILRSITSIYQPNNAHIISHKTILKHFKNTLKHSDMFRSCQFIIRELCSLLKLYYSIHNSIRICKRGVVAEYHVVWECVVEQWLGVRRTTHT